MPRGSSFQPSQWSQRAFKVLPLAGQLAHQLSYFDLKILKENWTTVAALFAAFALALFNPAWISFRTTLVRLTEKTN